MVGGVSPTPPTDEPTPALREALAPAPVKPRPTPGAAFVLARSWVRAGRRLDMAALAAELGVSRNTLYRWTGDRDRLLADVVWDDLSAMVARSLAATSAPPGFARLEEAGSRLLDLIVEESALRALLANEGAAGLRMLTAPGGPIRPRLVALVAAAIEAEVLTGAYRAPAAPQVLADGVLSLGERFLHHGGDPALNPDPVSAKTIISLLLREPPR
ncbi:MAG: TetR family transcriptional regulator [Conexibacter sp.]|nr:TetR family transcriptional regulator [Conexibacter sp.]